MDTIETTPAPETTDIAVVIEDEETETPSFGSEVAKTLLISTATSAVLFGGIAVISKLTPKVQSYLASRAAAKSGKVDNSEAVVIDPETTPITEKD